MSVPVSLPGQMPVDSPPVRPPKGIQETARQFEALVIAELLKEARGDEEGWMGSSEDAGGATATGLAEEQFAQALAQRGGFGLSRQIAASLSAQSPKTPASDHAAAR